MYNIIIWSTVIYKYIIQYYYDRNIKISSDNKYTIITHERKGTDGWNILLYIEFISCIIGSCFIVMLWFYLNNINKLNKWIHFFPIIDIVITLKERKRWKNFFY